MSISKFNEENFLSCIIQVAIIKFIRSKCSSDGCIHQGGGEPFSSIRFKRSHKKKRSDTHVGELNSDHNQAKKKCEDLMRQEQSIKVAFASIDVVRLLLNQGLTFRGHHEDESSLHKDIITSCKLETIKAITEDLNGDYFSLLVDESCDVSRKEQMSIVLRYVDRWRFVVERFIGIVHVRDTSALCLKEAIVNYLAQHSLSLSHTRGQCYDGASNMQGHLSGLKL
ncbi:uncharacterized protein LOC132620142 [Lycium barbarum]|uniref:uncharacterized protein LOC132620142 n=1 Tax=Lycium barbarum TaxID=112863 RepID=UPI00293F26D1|nr:uncharacterized protein LOC132620142 [Lycium barbarum]